MDDRIHARITLALWYNDSSQWRSAVMEAHEAGLYSIWLTARAARQACDERRASEESLGELQVSERFRLWLSVCATDNW